MKDFTTGKQGTITAGLYDCDTNGTSCTLIASGTTNLDPWPSSWQAVTVDLGPVAHTIAANRSLVIHLAVVDPSDDSLWFAYDTTTHDSRLTIN